MNSNYCECCDSNIKLCSKELKKDNRLKFIHWEKIRKLKNNNSVDCIYQNGDDVYFIEFKNILWFKDDNIIGLKEKLQKKMEDSMNNSEKEIFKNNLINYNCYCILCWDDNIVPSVDYSRFGKSYFYRKLSLFIETIKRISNKYETQLFYCESFYKYLLRKYKLE